MAGQRERSGRDGPRIPDGSFPATDLWISAAAEDWTCVGRAFAVSRKGNERLMGRAFSVTRRSFLSRSAAILAFGQTRVPVLDVFDHLLFGVSDLDRGIEWV